MHKRFREQVVFIPFLYILTLGSLSNRDNDDDDNDNVNVNVKKH